MIHGANALQWARAAERKQRRSAIDYVRLTRPQRLFVSDRRRLVLWRDGNRLGKTFAAAWEIVHRARGTHPYLSTHRPPVKILVVSYSVEQMAPMCEAIWNMLPKDEIDPRNQYDPGRGFTGKPPRIVFVAGPGKGSVITFATYKAGSKKVAGGEYHAIFCDEPPTESMYGELKPRTLSTKGDFRICFTPTPDSPPLGWLRDLIDEGTVHEQNYGLSEANCWPEGAPRPLIAQTDIDEEVATWLEVEREMRLGKSWEPVVTGRWLTRFDDANVLPFDIADLPLGAFVAIGIDHGAEAGKQAAMLLVMENRDTLDARVWYCDETVSDGYTTPEQDAESILAMLRRNDLVYDDVDDWIGDRPTGENKHLVSKSNRDLLRQIARIIRRPVEQCARIHTPQKWAGSVTHGLRLLNGLFGSRTEHGEPRALVHSSKCPNFIQFCRTFRGDRRDPLKDVGDAGRYPVERNVKVRSWAGGRRALLA